MTDCVETSFRLPVPLTALKNIIVFLQKSQTSAFGLLTLLLLVGTTSGYLSGKFDTVMMCITDIFLSFLNLILSLAFVVMLGPSLNNAIIAIALTSWSSIARLARAKAMTYKKANYIAAARLQEASPLRIIVKSIMPHVPAFDPHSPDAEHGDYHSHCRRPLFSWSWRVAAAAGMKGDGRHRPVSSAR